MATTLTPEQIANINDIPNKASLSYVDGKLAEKVSFYETDTTKVKNIGYELNHQRLLGNTKLSPQIIQQEENEFTIKTVANFTTIEHLRIINTNAWENKIGILVGTPAQPNQRHYFVDLIIDGYLYGISMKKSYYNYLCDISFRNCATAILLGNPDNVADWVGAMTLDTLRFSAINTGIDLVATDTTSSITLDKCSFEGVNHSIKNSAALYIRNTYFGDQSRNPIDTNEPDSIVMANPGSKTVLRDCRLGLENRTYTNKTVTGLFRLSGTDNKPCSIYVDGGLIEISNNNNSHPTFSNGITTIYTSESALNRVYIDNVDFIPSDPKVNLNHTQIPYYLYDGYSCLASVNPLQNYVLNGNLASDNANALLENSSNDLSFEETLTNPFGGKVIKLADADNHTRLTLYYKIPSHLVGKRMTLELYACDASYGQVRVAHVYSDCSESVDHYFNSGQIQDGYRTPRITRGPFTPTKEIGRIGIVNHQDATKPLVLAGVILKEYEYTNQLSKYEEYTNAIYSTAIPTVGTWNVGDKVYNRTPTAGGYEGWVCVADGEPGTWKGFGAIQA